MSDPALTPWRAWDQAAELALLAVCRGCRGEHGTRHKVCERVARLSRQFRANAREAKLNLEFMAQDANERSGVGPEEEREWFGFLSDYLGSLARE